LDSTEGFSSSSDEGDYDTKATENPSSTEAAGGGEKRNVGTGKVSSYSCPELASCPAMAAAVGTNGRNGYALELAFRSRKSVCVETIEFLKVFSKQVCTNPVSSLVSSLPLSSLKSPAQ